jgi:hypothetical protein
VGHCSPTYSNSTQELRRAAVAVFVLKKMYTLYPTVSFVKNIGIDNSGQNSKFDLLNIGNKKLIKTHYKIIKQPVAESVLARKLIENFFKKKKLYMFKNILKKILNV